MLPRRLDWEGEEHAQTYDELVSIYYYFPLKTEFIYILKRVKQSVMIIFRKNDKISKNVFYTETSVEIGWILVKNDFGTFHL